MIKNGFRPKRPAYSSLGGPLWNLTQRCWSQRPQDRPDIWEAIEVLEKLSVFVFHYNNEYLTRAPSQEGRLDL